MRLHVGAGVTPCAMRFMRAIGIASLPIIGCLAIACSNGGQRTDRSATVAATATPVAARASSGCSSEQSGAGVETRTVGVAGAERTYRRYIPPAADGAMPALIDLHGLASNIDQQAAITRFEDVASEQGFVVLKPQGTGAPAHWDTAAGDANEDVAFISEMLDEVESQVCIDTARIYATGLSDGGLMAATLACALPDRIAAIGAVSGLARPAGCARTRAVPVIAFWGTKDVLLPYCGGVGPAVRALVRGDFASTPADPVCPPLDDAGFPPVEQLAGEWAQFDGCGAEPDFAQVAVDVERRAYGGCRDGASVVLYSVVGGGHTWPGSKFMQAVSAGGIAIIGHTTDSIDASRVIWSFLRGYALPS